MQVAPVRTSAGAASTPLPFAAPPGASTGRTGQAWEQGQDHSLSQPTPRWPQEQKRRLVDELRPWRLVICSTDPVISGGTTPLAPPSKGGTPLDPGALTSAVVQTWQG